MDQIIFSDDSVFFGIPLGRIIPDEGYENNIRQQYFLKEILEYYLADEVCLTIEAIY